jgi:hypothetical protein
LQGRKKVAVRAWKLLPLGLMPIHDESQWDLCAEDFFFGTPFNSFSFFCNTGIICHP